MDMLEVKFAPSEHEPVLSTLNWLDAFTKRGTYDYSCWVSESLESAQQGLTVRLPRGVFGQRFIWHIRNSFYPEDELYGASRRAVRRINTTLKAVKKAEDEAIYWSQLLERTDAPPTVTTPEDLLSHLGFDAEAQALIAKAAEKRNDSIIKFVDKTVHSKVFDLIYCASETETFRRAVQASGEPDPKTFVTSALADQVDELEAATVT